ncbi:hypothetical protein HV169_16280 [Citrobacter freundii]|uniref:hypothetical protein n=1 Tax=Citrobacter freundii TaxID=546 RepID=UPI0015F7856B|nr:hypothetical protein [Citrobacter freundii]
MKKIAFEVSDNIAIYSHMLPLLHAFIKSNEVFVSLYSVSEDNFAKLQEEYRFYYGQELVVFEQVVLPDNRLSNLKKKVVAVAKKYHLTVFLPIARRVFTSFRKSKNNNLDDFSNFYKRNSGFFLKQNVIFTTELKGCVPFEGFPKLVWLLHGIISNDNPFYKDWNCDLVVSPQIGLIEKLRASTSFPHDSKMYTNAYLKYDLIKRQQSNRIINVFQQKKYTVLYNPHWDNGSGQSSWFKFGIEILEFFYNRKDINFIFAPHISLAKFYDIKIPNKYTSCENIHIDLKSEDLVRGTYISQADCYLGDVSSQYFEFILCKPNIDAIFFNVAGLDWHASSVFSYWNDGVVISDVKSLDEALVSAGLNKKVRQKRFHEIPDNQVESLLLYIKTHFLE